jgi:uncharacterized protein YcfL
MQGNRLATFTILTAGLMLAGCAAKDPLMAPAQPRNDPLPASAYPQLVTVGGLDEGLGFWPPIVEPSTPERGMDVTVPVRSMVDYPLNVQYRFEFLDDLDRPLRSDIAGWGFIHMEPRLRVELRGNAIDNDAKDWRLYLRPAR